MIRILIIDDLREPEFIEDMRRTISGSLRMREEEVDIRHINPVDLIASAHEDSDEQEHILEQIGQAAEEFWDVVSVDVNLADVPLSGGDALHLSLAIAERVREVNRSATLILYSGTLREHVNKLLAGEQAESALKRIYRGDITAFVRRNQIIGEALSAINNPSWLLQVDRLLMKHGSLVVVPDEGLIGGRSLQQLARSLRKQDQDGLKIAGFIVDLGVSALTELAS